MLRNEDGTVVHGCVERKERWMRHFKNLLNVKSRVENGVHTEEEVNSAHLFNTSLQYSFIPSQWKYQHSANRKSTKSNISQRTTPDSTDIISMQITRENRRQINPLTQNKLLASCSAKTLWIQYHK
jgi:hypothetical protein